MRLRNEGLRTGSLLTYFTPADRSSNRSLLWLVSGMPDVGPLTRAEAACRRLLAEHPQRSSFEWHAVADQGALADIDPCLDPSQVVRLEARELDGLNDEELARFFAPVLERLASCAAEIFPAAGGAVGNPAEGIQLLGRSQVVMDLAARLAAGEHLHLVAPRRSGKTSVLLRLAQPAADLRAAYLDLERARDERHAAALLRAMAREESPRQALEKIGKDWARELRSSLERLQRRRGAPTALLLDEPVFFLRGLRDGEESSWRAAIREFLQALARAVDAAKVTLLVAGSTDLEEFLRDEVGLSLSEIPQPLSNLNRVPLPPLDADAVELRRLLVGTGLVLAADELAWLQDHLDLTLPYPALLFLDHLAGKARSAQPPAGGASLDRLLSDFLSQTFAFRDLQERINRRAEDRGDLRKRATSLLDRLIVSPLPRAEVEAALATPGDVLWFVETFPVTDEAGEVRLVSRLFGRWWRLVGG